MVDIAKLLKPLSVDLPGIGPVVLRVGTVGFLAWFGDAEKAGRWHDAGAFLHAFLRERVGPPEDEENDLGPTLELTTLDALDADQLEAIAETLLHRMEPMFSLVRDEEAEVGESTPLLELSTDGLAPAAGRLLSAVRGYDRNSKASHQRMLDRLTTTFELGTVAREMSRYQKLLAMQRDYQKLIARQDDIEKLTRGASTLAQIGRLYSEGRIGGALHPKLGVTIPNFAAIGAMPQLLGIGALQTSLWPTANKLLGLGISDTVLKTAMGLSGLSDFASSTERAAAALFRAGYGTVASMAVEGAVAAGAASDLLAAYDLPVGDASTLLAVRGAVTVLDNPDASDADRLSRLEVILRFFAPALHYTRAEFEKAGLIALLSLAIAILTAYPTLQAMLDEAPPNKEMREAVDQLKALRGDLENAQHAPQETRIRYVHGRVNLRAEPRRDGLVLRFVYPDQWVEIRDTQGDWAWVAVYDYASDASLEGWIYRANLHRVAN